MRLNIIIKFGRLNNDEKLNGIMKVSILHNKNS
jgi:hypothetical protein